MAVDLFGVGDSTILDAIRCHTTLKSNPSQLDLLLFIADKLSWDQRGTPPFKQEMEEALSDSLEAAAWVYLEFLWHSGRIQIAHPWMLDAYQGLKARHKLL